MNGCVIAGTPIAVDIWRITKTPTARLFFLTHAHADHMDGLTSSWCQPIRCSELTARIVKKKIGIDDRYLIPLVENEAHLVALDEENQETMTVTPIVANHCPGAVMFLFEGYFGRILYTGDFRYHPDMFEKETVLGDLDGPTDRLYLDNTFCSPACQFPSQNEARLRILTLVRENLDKRIVIPVTDIGKEDLFECIAKVAQTYIHVTPEKMELLKLLEVSEVFTVDDDHDRIQLIPRRALTVSKVKTLNAEEPTVVIVPSALSQGVEGLEMFQNVPNVHVVPYSSHSSYSELHEFVKCIKPRKIIPIVRYDKDKISGRDCSDRMNMNVFSDITSRQGSAKKFTIPDTVQRFMRTARPNTVLSKQPVVKRKSKTKSKASTKGVVYRTPESSLELGKDNAGERNENGSSDEESDRPILDNQDHNLTLIANELSHEDFTYRIKTVRIPREGSFNEDLFNTPPNDDYIEPVVIATNFVMEQRLVTMDTDQHPTTGTDQNMLADTDVDSTTELINKVDELLASKSEDESTELDDTLTGSYKSPEITDDPRSASETDDRTKVHSTVSPNDTSHCEKFHDLRKNIPKPKCVHCQKMDVVSKNNASRSKTQTTYQIKPCSVVLKSIDNDSALGQKINDLSQIDSIRTQLDNNTAGNSMVRRNKAGDSEKNHTLRKRTAKPKCVQRQKNDNVSKTAVKTKDTRKTKSPVLVKSQDNSSTHDRKTGDKTHKDAKFQIIDQTVATVANETPESPRNSNLRTKSSMGSVDDRTEISREPQSTEKLKSSVIALDLIDNTSARCKNLVEEMETTTDMTESRSTGLKNSSKKSPHKKSLTKTANPGATENPKDNVVAVSGAHSLDTENSTYANTTDWTASKAVDSVDGHLLSSGKSGIRNSDLPTCAFNKSGKCNCGLLSHEGIVDLLNILVPPKLETSIFDSILARDVVYPLPRQRTSSLNETALSLPRQPKVSSMESEAQSQQPAKKLRHL